jgi:hypothetical protein
MRDVIIVIKELKKDIPLIMMEETKAWTLLNALHLDTHMKVLKEH